MFRVEFPGLWGLEFHINRIAYEIMGMPIYWYGIIISIGFGVATYLALKNCHKFGIKQDDFSDVLLIATPSSIIGARLYYVVFNFNEFGWDIAKIINIRSGGIAIYGAIIGALLSAYLYCLKKKINFLKLADLAMPYFVLAQAIGRWGNFFNQEAFGTNTSLPWGMKSEGTQSYILELKSRGVDLNPLMPVHPTFLYESLWNLSVFCILLYVSKNIKFTGQILYLYMILYGIGRFWIESLRTDSLYLADFRISQVLAAFFVILFTIIYIKKINIENKCR